MKWLVLTTAYDRSLAYFQSSNTTIRYYDDVMLLPHGIDIVYFRDPFNGGEYDSKAIEQAMQLVVNTYPEAYYIDSVRHFNDLLIEDKWRQYELMNDLCLETWRMDHGDYPETDIIIKKRISSRARDIYFSINDVDKSLAGEYIVQRRAIISEEYRVYTVCGKVLPYMSRKSSKTETTKVKIEDIEPTRDDIGRLVERALQKLALSFDFLGFDVAQTDRGLVLIEVNRSPQFVRYAELLHVNPMDDVRRHIQQRLMLD